MVLSVRASVDPLTLQKAITAAIRSVNKDQAIIDVRTVDQIRDLAMAGRRLQSVLLSVFGAVALVLAGLGVYGVISYSVAQRTREMGIRAALGASKPSLLRLVFQRAAWLTAVGLALGMAGAIGAHGTDGQPALQRQPARSGDDDGSGVDAGGGCWPGVIRARAACDEDRSDRGVAL